MTQVIADDTRVIADDTEAVAVAAEPAARFAREAVLRDAERILPRTELDELSDSGLLGITVPRSHGGAEVSARTLGEVVRLLSAADASIGQIAQNHFFWRGCWTAAASTPSSSLTCSACTTCTRARVTPRSAKTRRSRCPTRSPPSPRWRR